MWTVNFQMFKLDLENAEEPEIKLPTCSGSSKKQESSRKTCTSALLTMPKTLTVWITANVWPASWEICYAGQESSVRAGHGTTFWFQIGKGVYQGYIFSPCLFNLYGEYIFRNAGLDEAHARIMIARRNSNNFRYPDVTTLMAEQKRTKEPLDEIERGEWKRWLKTQHLENRLWHVVPSLNGK